MIQYFSGQIKLEIVLNLEYLMTKGVFNNKYSFNKKV